MFGNSCLHISQTKLFVGELVCELTICGVAIWGRSAVVVDGDAVLTGVDTGIIDILEETGSESDVLTSGGLGDGALTCGSLLQLPGDAEEDCCDDWWGLWGSEMP